MARLIASSTPNELFVYSASEVMDDVTFSWRLEMNKRAMKTCQDPDELRRIGMECIVLMQAQRSVLRQVLEDWGK